tara:strand:- start:13 stop:324 length:312 start_codon:yes stop_codon:yes gene_type:complete
MSRKSQARVNYLLLQVGELKLLAKKLIQNGLFDFDTETDEKLVKSLAVKYLTESEVPVQNTKTGCSDCGAELSGSPSGHKYEKRCGPCYLKWKAEKRKQSGQR